MRESYIRLPREHSGSPPPSQPACVSSALSCGFKVRLEKAYQPKYLVKVLMLQDAAEERDGRLVIWYDGGHYTLVLFP